MVPLAGVEFQFRKTIRDGIRVGIEYAVDVCLGYADMLPGHE